MQLRCQKVCRISFFFFSCSRLFAIVKLAHGFERYSLLILVTAPPKAVLSPVFMGLSWMNGYGGQKKSALQLWSTAYRWFLGR